MSAAGPAGGRSLIQRITQPTLGGALGVLFVGAGAAIGLRSLADNSFLTHLATGRLILDSGSVPSHDPYTFTAAGEPWTVQSWLASLLYAVAEDVARTVVDSFARTFDLSPVRIPLSALLETAA